MDSLGTSEQIQEQLLSGYEDAAEGRFFKSKGDFEKDMGLLDSLEKYMADLNQAIEIGLKQADNGEVISGDKAYQEITKEINKPQE